MGCAPFRRGVALSDRGDYRDLARQCLRQAEVTQAPGTRTFLVMMAEAWMKLAERCDQLQSVTIKIGERATLHSKRMQYAALPTRRSFVLLSIHGDRSESSRSLALAAVRFAAKSGGYAARGPWSM
jgi:hypothetical protein